MSLANDKLEFEIKKIKHYKNKKETLKGEDPLNTIQTMACK